jgi:hypothetical protein
MKKLLIKLANSAAFRKAVYLIGGILTGLSLFAAPALASSTIDPVALLKGLLNFIVDIMFYIGIFMILFGGFTFGMSFSSQDSQQRTRGIVEMVGGLLVVGLKVILNTVGVTW